MWTNALWLRFFEFSVDEFEKYIDLLYFNGLKHSPRLSQKFKTNEEDVCQGNDFLLPVFGPYTEHHLK